MRDILKGQQGVRFQKLTPEQCERIHGASCRLLETVGVEAHHERAREILGGAGAQVEGTRVRVPRALVDWALSVTPKEFTLHTRGGEPVMPVGGTNVFFGVGSGTLNILDHRTGERRPTTLADTVEGARVVDALPNIDFHMSLFTPLDLEQRMAYVHEFKAMLRNTTKPYLFLSHSAADIRAMVEMLEAVVGGADELRERPRGLGYINVTHPFRHEFEDLEKLLYLAEKRVPYVHNPMAIRGASGPITKAGSMAAANAGELFGLVLAQLVSEGCPASLSGGTADKLDMRTMINTYSAPEDRVAYCEMARHYDIPHFGLAGASDSKLVDEQSAAEAALTMLVEALAGSNLIHDVGYMESGMSNSLAQVVICDEVIGWIRRFMDPIVVDEETLALELIERIAPMGDYLAEDHTMAHYEEDWYPGLFDQSSHDKWVKAGSLRLGEKAARRVDHLLETHQVEDLSPDVLEQLDAIIAARATWGD
ncbi:MAG: trimethylamine methyltransferase family protein [Thermoleophilia bacterium]